jgi:signal transduction histidine kinase
LKRYEKEAILKNFAIFFSLQALLIAIIYTQSLSSAIEKLNIQILENMKLCSYTLKCKNYSYDFVPKQNQEVAKLNFDNNEIYSLFHIPKADEFLLKISLAKSDYIIKKSNIQSRLKSEFLLYTIATAIFSLLFSFYTLQPLKKALQLKREFLKDILHDYNTPISSLIVNFKLLKKEIGQNNKITRMERSVDTLLSLQNNIKYFIENSLLNKEHISIYETILQRVDNFKSLYPDLDYNLSIKDFKIYTNKDAFIRIIDNLLSNASKHNIERGYINIYSKESTIYFENSTKGIKNPELIFKREYQEGKRGSGLGLNIVYKLSKELNIKIDTDIENKKVIFILKLENVINS